MKRVNGEGTISQRKSDSRWIGQITVGYDKGKAIRKSCSAKTKQECRAKLDKLKMEYYGRSLTYRKLENAKMPYVEYLRTCWLPEKRDVELLEQSTIETHMDRIKCYFDPFFQGTEIQDIDTPLIARFYAWLSKKLSPESVHKVHAIVNNSFKKAVRDDIVIKNPTIGIRLPKVHPHEKRSLTDEEVTLLLKTAKSYIEEATTQNKNIYMIIYLAIVSGMRRGELLALTWDNVDFYHNKIYVEKSVSELKNGIVIKRPKTDSSVRSMILPKEMMDLLREHRQTWATGKYVFPSLHDKDFPQAPSNMCRAFRKVVSIANISASFHLLRHTNITNMISSGVNIKTVKQRAGHSRIETTMSYTHPDEELDKQAGDVFLKFL